MKYRFIKTWIEGPFKDSIKSLFPAAVMNLPNLSGKVCLVTGASRGIGRGIAQQLAKSGATVYITGRKLPDLKQCAEEMSQSAGGDKDILPLQGIPIGAGLKCSHFWGKRNQ